MKAKRKVVIGAGLVSVASLAVIVAAAVMARNDHLKLKDIAKELATDLDGTKSHLAGC